MTVSEDLPHGWAWATLGELLREPLRNGHSAKATNTGEGLPTLTLTAVTKGRFTQDNIKLTTANPASVEDLWLEPGDILIERANTPELVGTAALFPGPSRLAIFPDLLIRARMQASISIAFVAHFLKSDRARRHFRSRAQGIAGTMPKIDQSAVEELALPLAPRPEQDRIVETIEQQLSDIDAGVAGVERALANLKRYRASVLKDACEGRLVRTEAELARKENRNYEPADVLLRRILKERRARWEADQLAKMKAKGQSPKDDKWKANYEEPETNGIRTPAPQEGWCWAAIDQVSICVDYGSSAKTSADALGTPVLRMGNIINGKVVFDELKYLPTDHSEFPELHLMAGDMLFNRTNSAELVGKTAVFGGTQAPCSFASYLIRVRLEKGCLPHYVCNVINSPLGRGWISSVVSQQVGQANVNGSKLKAFAIPLPPLAEQHRIVAEVDRLLSTADETEQTLRAQLARAARLRQAVLKHAFEGKLVPQDPNDEPATALLARLRAHPPAAPKRGPRTKKP